MNAAQFESATLPRAAREATQSPWELLSAPLPPTEVQWRQDGRPVQRDGRYIARFVPYIDAHFVRERLDSVLPGEWDSTLELLPPPAHVEGVVSEEPIAFKCRLQVLGVIREDVGTGANLKEAATDAFKRAGVRFGIGAELYSMGQVWVQMDGDGKFAQAVEEPATAYARRNNKGGQQATGAVIAIPNGNRPASTSGDAAPPAAAPPSRPASAGASPACPKCGGDMWDDRLTKRNPKAPDFKCKKKPVCDGVIWPPKEDVHASPFRPGDEAPHPADEIPF